MSADRSMRGKPQRLRVSIYKASELRAWANYWGCTQQYVRDAVKTSGVMAEDVQDWLKINVVRCHVPPDRRMIRHGALRRPLRKPAAAAGI